jgi:glycerol-3-phosphate dehydrogenase
MPSSDSSVPLDTACVPLSAAECTYDLLVVGGGINGAGIARDAAGRGLSVLLVEKEDLAQHTSSASTKLIHGGLRYLEYGEFRLVREALIERERLLSMAPHIIWPLSFVLPQVNSPRPAWLVRLGLFLYDHLGGRKVLPATRTIAKLDRDPRGNGLKSGAAGERTAASSSSTQWTLKLAAPASAPAPASSPPSAPTASGPRRFPTRAESARSAPAPS